MKGLYTYGILFKMRHFAAQGVRFCPGCGAPTGDQQETPKTGSAAQANAGAANQANGAFNTDTINEKIAQFSI